MEGKLLLGMYNMEKFAPDIIASDMQVQIISANTIHGYNNVTGRE